MPGKLLYLLYQSEPLALLPPRIDGENVQLCIDATTCHHLSLSTLDGAGHQQAVGDPRLLHDLDTLFGVPDRKSTLLVHCRELIHVLLILVECNAVNSHSWWLFRVLLPRSLSLHLIIIVLDSLPWLKSEGGRYIVLLIRASLLDRHLHSVMLDLFPVVLDLLLDLFELLLLLAGVCTSSSTATFHIKLIYIIKCRRRRLKDSSVCLISMAASNF